MREIIFIFGYYGWNNTGDDAILYALLQELNSLNPEAEFCICSHAPVVVPPPTECLVRFVDYSPKTILREIVRSDCFIMGGGTHIYDYNTTTKQRRVVIKMLMMLFWAKVCCQKIYLIDIGIEPLSTFWGKALTKEICNLSDIISVRDSISYKVLGELGVKKVKLSFDLAALLPQPGVRKRDMRIIGVSILPFFEIYHNNKEKDLLFVGKIADALNCWLKEDPRAMVRLFAFKGKSKEDDVAITAILKSKLMPKERVELIPYDSNPLGTLARVAECHAFIGMRYHSCLFAYLTGTPLLVINYFRKCQALAEDIRLPRDAVVSLEDVIDGNIEGCFRRIREHPEDFMAKLPIEIARNMAKKYLPTGDIA